MPKRCPKCGEVYGDAAVFCDQEGEPLVRIESTQSAGRGRPQRNIWLLVFAALTILLTAGIIVKSYLLPSHIRDGVQVVVEKISLSTGKEARRPNKGTGTLDQITGDFLGFANALTGSQEIIVRIRVRNNTLFSGSVASASYALMVGDKEVGNGIWSPPDGKPQTLATGEEITIGAPLRVDGQNALASVVDKLSGKESPVRVRGNVAVSMAWITLTIPFEVQKITIDMTNPR